MTKWADCLVFEFYLYLSSNKNSNLPESVQKKYNTLKLSALQKSINNLTYHSSVKN
jgi:hypothetical protein